MRKLKKEEKPALEFFADLGVLVLPYAFDENGTTYWHYESHAVGDSLEASILPVGYEGTHLNVHSFFYRKKEILDQVGLMMDLDLNIRRLALEHRHALPGHESLIEPTGSRVNYIPSEILFEADETTRTDEFSILNFIGRIAQLTNIWDPMGWRKEGIPHYNYEIDFCKYGFGLWNLRRKD